MNILLIHQYYKDEDITGGARFNEMTRIWKNEGHNITVISGNLFTGGKKEEYKGKFITKKTINGIEVWKCYVSDSYNINFLGRMWAYFSFVFSGTYAGLFKARGHFDVIVVTSPPLFVGIIAYILSIFKRVPFVFEVRDLWPESAIDTGVLRNKAIIKFAYWFEKFIYKRASLINVLTPAFYNVLLNEKNVSKEKLIMIPNAADFAISENVLQNCNRDQIRKERGWEGKFVITYVGAHGVANGLFQLIEVAKSLTDTNVLFVLVGSGMQKQKLIDKVESENLNNIVFHNPVPKKEVFEFIIGSDMGASILMKNDTFKTVYSNKTFDYMSCKKPVLMVIDGVSRELVEKANAGVFIEPENPIDFSNKIRYYLNNPELIKEQGENGYNYAKENFDREVLALKYLSAITNLLKR